MRFCPFCSAENAGSATHCGACARKLPPLPERRAASTPAPATSPRTAAPQRPATSVPPPPHLRSSTSVGSRAASVPLGAATRRRESPLELPRPAGTPGRRAGDQASSAPAPALAVGWGAGQHDSGPGDGVPEHAPEAPAHPVAEPSRRGTLPGSGPVVNGAIDSGAPRADTSEAALIDPAADPVRPDTSDSVTRLDSDPAGRFETGEPTRLDSDPGDRFENDIRTEIDAPPLEALAREAAGDPDDSDASTQVQDEPGPPERVWRRLATPVPPPERLARRLATPRPLPPIDRAASPSSAGLTPPTLPEPPRTRVTVTSDARTSFRPPELVAVPEVPEAGPLNAALYALRFLRARWARRSVIKSLNDDIRQETTSLDHLLGLLGKQARAQRINNSVLASENAAIDAAEDRKRKSDQAAAELDNRQAEENQRFVDISAERESKVEEAEAALEKAEREQETLEGQRRALRDKRKQVERMQKTALKDAEDREDRAQAAQLGDERTALRKAADDARREAAKLDPERQDVERRLAALEKPISQAMAKVETLKQETEGVRRGLNDAREGHRHRLAEIEAELGRKSRELALAHAEVGRRLVTLGTLTNLHRIDAPEFAELYRQVDELRGAIGGQSTEIDRLIAEREAYDKASLVRGLVSLAGGVVVIITVIVLVSVLL